MNKVNKPIGNIHFAEKCPRRDSNPHHQNRNLTFYPLNYEDLFYIECKNRKVIGIMKQ